VTTSEGTVLETLLGLVIVAVLIGVNAVLVAGEFSLMAADRARIAALSREGSRPAQLVDQVVSRLSYYLSGAQLGITISSLLLGYLVGPLVASAIEPVLDAVLGASITATIVYPLALILAVALQMLAGELVPKTIAIARPVPTAMATAPALRFLGVVVGPVIGTLNSWANLVVRALGIEPTDELASVRSLEEIELLIDASIDAGSVASDEVAVLHNALKFSDKDATDLLVPRADVVTLSHDESVDALIALASSTGHSRFPVIGEDLDEVVGVVHVKRAVAVRATQRASLPVSSLMDPPFFVVPSLSLDELLGELQRGTHLAIVLDEYGGNEGIVTLEDLLEQLVGEIDDEYDEESAPAVAHVDGSWEVEGAIHRDEVAELTGLELEGPDFETLAGYLLIRLGRLAQGSEVVEVGQWRLQVTGVERHRITSVKVTRIHSHPKGEPAIVAAAGSSGTARHSRELPQSPEGASVARAERSGR